jgi:hypothetical protein
LKTGKAETMKAITAELRANFSAGWDGEKDALCKRILGDLWPELGEERLWQTVRDCMRHEQFFNENAVRKHIPPQRGRKKTCRYCEGTHGFIYVLPEGCTTPYMTACQHWEQLPTSMSVVIGIPGINQRRVWATVCDAA